METPSEASSSIGEMDKIECVNDRFKRIVLLLVTLKVHIVVLVTEGAGLHLP